jgi:hypothetical protein
MNWSPARISAINQATWQWLVVRIFLDNVYSHQSFEKIIIVNASEFILSHFIAGVIAISNTPSLKASSYVRNIKVHLFWLYPLVVPSALALMEGLDD